MTQSSVPVGERLPLRRPAFESLTPYVADGPRAELHLADNTNLFGAPPPALEAILASTAADAVHYPPSTGPRLREAIAAYLRVQPDEVVVACGADSIIDCAMRAFCEPGDSVAFPNPTFVMARYFALANTLRPMGVPVRPGGAADVDALCAAKARAFYICAPNNPTGLQPSAAELRQVLNQAPGLVMLDEAYAEFAGSTLAPEIPRHGRAIVIRTFSKAFGLAGLRVGYAIGARELVREIDKARGPFAVSTLALRAATAAITQGLPWVQARVADAIAAREELVRQLRARGFEPLDSAGNFVLLPLREAEQAAQRLAGAGIAVRLFPQLSGIGPALRITVGPPDAMTRLLDALTLESA
jgi:histidinol-phosphate aminotransferase